MLLSKVAERIYWSARYLERSENTARLINVYANLLFDLPDDTGISWYNLVIASGGRRDYDARLSSKEERAVVKFLLADKQNHSSLLSSLNWVRENIRTTRDVVPMETWELVNELHIYAKDNIQQGINRTKRHEFLDEVIQACQQINGLFEGTMSRDAPWQFVRLGRNLERADMTTRILEAGVSMLAELEDEAAADVSDVIWGNVLRSLNGYYPFRRTMRVAVSGEDVADFLIGDEHFPRTVQHCVDAMVQSSGTLPRNANVSKSLKSLQRLVNKQVDYRDLDALNVYLNDLQSSIGKMHGDFAETWFQLN